MRASEPGESAIALPWVAPGTAALVALARDSSPAVWPAVRTDPGAVLLLARHLPPEAADGIPDGVFQSPSVLETALQLLRDGAPGAVDWTTPETRPVHEAAVACATFAELIARRTGGCDPALAWIGGLLAPLGWLAVCAADPSSAGECLREPAQGNQFATVQRELWRLDAQAIARRLARRWRLPSWLRIVAGHLGVPAELAVGLGADERLFRLVQLSVLLATDQGHDLGMTVGSERAELLASLGICDADLRDTSSGRAEVAPPLSTDGTTAAPLQDLLVVAIEKRRLENGPQGERLEDEVDRLQEALAARRAGEAERLRVRKLLALAEFAAGAGHEINNPLAVISGHAQCLLNAEGDPGRQASLRGIVRQTERIHAILTDLMQFARPPLPRRQDVDLRHVMEEVVGRLRPLADERRVRLTHTDYEERMAVHADPSMIRTALTCLVRNALEAASRDGWVKVGVDQNDDHWEIVVEDSGLGPEAARREQIFDPFFSGRTAGRGRGLGLPTAWRLARENGGDVGYEPTPECAARFVLSLPVCARGTTVPGAASDELRRTA